MRTAEAVAEAFLDGNVHTVPDDLCKVLGADVAAVALWQALTPLGRNEFLCWIEDAKQLATRTRRMVRTLEELHEGKRRPCCWAGCVHRTDKAPGKWQQAVLMEGRRR
jgi:uncharacterized protein YdeI (YjbR/CyaY-like superfamily)